MIDLLRTLMDLLRESCFRVPCLRSFFDGTCWQTTRVMPGGFLFRAVPSDRMAGTAPPAAGLTEVSAPGFGQ